MSRKHLFVFSILIVLALIAAACQPAEEEAATGGAGQGEIVQRILDRGSVVCGSRTDLAGFGELDANGRNVGFDIDLCRAIAAALLDDPEAVESTADRRG
jgi:general L-amino acid transport system substrate-binding protein